MSAEAQRRRRARTSDVAAAAGARAAEEHLRAVDAEALTLGDAELGHGDAGGVDVEQRAPHDVHSRWWWGAGPMLGS